MISIENENDVENLETTMFSHPLIARFLKNYITSITSQYLDYELSEYGSFYFLESEKDVKTLYIMDGIKFNLLEETAEYTELITLQGKREQVKIVHVCFIISDCFAISVFTEVGTLELETEKNLLKDNTERTVQLN